MFTAARASVALETRKGRTATVRPSTNLLISSMDKDSTTTLRLQRLRPLGIVGAQADLLAQLIWGADGGNDCIGGAA